MSILKSFDGGIARNIVGAFVLGLAAGIVAALFMLEIPPTNERVAFTILGLVIGWAGSVVNFHFGTSEGSKTKTKLMQKAAPAESKPDGEIV